MYLRIIPVATSNHPLHQLGRTLRLEDLHGHRHSVIRESGSKRNTNAQYRCQPALDCQQCSDSDRSNTNQMEYGFAWVPEEKIRNELRDGSLKPLPLGESGERFVQLYLIIPDVDAAGPGVLRLAQIIRDAVASECVRHGKNTCTTYRT